MSTGTSSPPRSASSPACPGTTIGQWARWGYIRSSASDGEPRVYGVEDVGEATIVARAARPRRLARRRPPRDRAPRRRVRRVAAERGAARHGDASAAAAASCCASTTAAACCCARGWQLMATPPRGRGGPAAAQPPPPSRLNRRAARPTGEASIASPALPTATATRCPARPSGPCSAGMTASAGSQPSSIAAAARVLLDRAHALLPAGVEGGELLVAARGRERGRGSRAAS